MTFRGRHRADSSRLGSRFRILLVGQTVSFLGDKMAYISLPLFVAYLAVEGSSTELGIAYALESAPTLLLGFLGGVVIDRLRVRPVMIVADLARAAAFLYLAAIAFDAPASGSGGFISTVYVIAFLVGSFTTLFNGGLYTLIPSLVSRRELALANSRIVLVESVWSMLGPSVAGLLISLTAGFGVVFLVDALTFVASAVAIALIGPVERPEGEHDARGVMADVMNGLRYIWNELRLRISTGALALGNLVVGFIEATFVLAAAEVVGADEGWQQGILFGMLGVGSIAGALVVPTVVRLLGLGRTMVAGMVGFGLAFTIFVNHPFSLAGLIYLFIAFVSLQMINVPVATIRQTYTPQVMLGRVITATRALAWATLPLGALAGTALADRVGFELVTKVAPILILVVGLGLIGTVIWRDTDGPGRGRRIVPRPARRVVRI